MDCDDVVMMLAASERPTLSGAEETQLEDHLASCVTCQQLQTDVRDDEWRWIARVPEEALADPNLLVLPTVDPVVFEHREELAAGGMGRISRVHDRRLGREVAVKEMLAPEMRVRFEREAMITARLQHPAIVPIYEAGAWPDGSAFYTMRLVPGGTLATAIANAKTLEQRLALLPHVIAVTEALAYAHSRGVIHRDLKPNNVLVGEFGETVVIDWGLAKQLGHDDDEADLRHAAAKAGLTMAGSIMGTPGFMSPEQAAGEPLDERADVYALGSILYHLLAGAAPYSDEALLINNSDLLIEAARKRAPTPIVERAPGAPADLLAIVEHAMARPKEARYRTAKDMADELRRFEAGQLLASREYRVRDLLGRWIRRHRTAVLVATIALVALASVGVVALVNVTRSRAAAQHSSKTALGTLAALLEEQGRTELLQGDRDRALGYLAESYRLGRDTTALRHLLAQATTDLDVFERTIESDRNVRALGFTADGDIALAAWGEDPLAIWHDDRRIATHPLVDFTSAWFDPDGKRAFVTTEAAGAMFDIATGKQLWFGSALADARKVVFDPTGQRVAIFSDLGQQLREVQVRDAETGELVMTLPGEANDVAFDELGASIANATYSGIHLYDLETKAWVGDFPTTERIRMLRFVGEDIVASTYDAGGLLLWKRAEKVVKTLGGHAAEISAIDVSPYAHVIATADELGAVRTWSASGNPLAESHDMRGEIEHIAFSPDGVFLAGVGTDPRAYIWESSTLALRRTLDASTTAVSNVKWSPDGAHLATVSSTDSGARVWRMPKGIRVKRMSSAHSATAQHRVATLDEGSLVIYDAATGKRVAEYDLPFPVTVVRHGTFLGQSPEIQLSHDATRALVIGEGKAAVYDVDTGEHREFALLQGFPSPNPVLSADGRWVLEDVEERVRVIDAGTAKPILDRPLEKGRTLLISPDGSLLVALLVTDAKAWKLPSGEEVSFEIPMQQFTGVFDQSGDRLMVIYGEDARVFDGHTTAEISKLVSPAAIDRVRFDATGGRAITTCRDRAARLWNVDTGALLASVDGVTDGAIAVTDDGERFATGHDDGTIRIWDSASGRLLQQLRAHRNKVLMLTFAVGGTRLVSLADDAHTSIFDVHLEQRPAPEISSLAARFTHWAFAGGQLVRR